MCRNVKVNNMVKVTVSEVQINKVLLLVMNGGI